MRQKNPRGSRKAVDGEANGLGKKTMPCVMMSQGDDRQVLLSERPYDQ